MSIDFARVRAETPGVAHVLHFNNAGAGLMPAPVLDAVKAHLDLEARIGGYEAAARATAAFQRTYDAIGELINADPQEIALMENATVAWQAVFHAMCRRFKTGDKILTVEAEYVTNYISYLQAKELYGLTVEVVPSEGSGAVDLDALSEMIDDRVKLISMTHVPTNGGLVNPAAAVGAIAKDAGVLYLLDACQSVGQVPVDVEEIGCDALSVTGRKYLRGPRGTGFLYVRKELADELEPIMIDLHGAEWTRTNAYELEPGAKRFENWEFYVAGVIGLGVAVDYALALGLDATSARLTDLAATLRIGLADVPGVTVADIGAVRGGIVTFTKAGLDPNDIKARLGADGINVSVTGISSTRLDMEKRGLTSLVRSSVHYYNDEDEVARFVRAVDVLK